MAHVLMFHHVLGLTEGVRAFAERLRAAGHEVELPDLFNGHTFTSIAAGMEYANGIGEDLLAEAGAAAAHNLPENLVYAGFSMGVASAMKLVQERPGARGALFYHGIVPLGYFGDNWPANVPLQIHMMKNDPYEAEEEVQTLAQEAQGELFLYDVATHLFTDRTVDGYDRQATELVMERSLRLLEMVD